MHQNLNLNWLRSFEAAARLLSFTAASHELGLTQTAVSQHIKSLELRLGDALFRRRPKSLQLTDLGNAYLVPVRTALDTIEMSTTGLFGPRQNSTIVVRSSMAFITWLSPKLGAFQKDYPETVIKLLTSIWKGPADQHPGEAIG
jgi:LysR family glycine cleavage system transcriptional activator